MGVTYLNMNFLGNWGFSQEFLIMYSGNLMFAQLIKHLSLHTLRRYV